MAQAVSYHNTKLLRDDNGGADYPPCNCRGGLQSCTVGYSCQSKGVVYEATVTEEEEGGFKHDSPRAITEEPKATMLAESRNDNITFDLSRLSETNIDEVGDASDETWLLSSSSTESPTVKAMEGAGDTSGAKALRSRSANKDNTFEGVASARFFFFYSRCSMIFKVVIELIVFPTSNS